MKQYKYAKNPQIQQALKQHFEKEIFNPLQTAGQSF
jgi:hypothetical protein